MNVSVSVSPHGTVSVIHGLVIVSVVFICIGARRVFVPIFVCINFSY